MQESTQDCFRGAVFVDILAGKLDMWLCMAESVEVNQWKMKLEGNTYFLFASSPSVCAV